MIYYFKFIFLETKLFFISDLYVHNSAIREGDVKTALATTINDANVN